MKHLTFAVLCLSLSLSCLKAQDCKDMIRRANDAYEKGYLTEVRSILTEECIQTLLDVRDKQEAYYMLAVASLYLKDLDSAKNTMLTILNDDPEYVCKRRTPIGFQKFYETFRTKPIMIWGGKAGINSSQIKSIKSYTLDDQSIGQEGTYKSAFGFQISGTFILPLWKRIDAIGELGFKRYTYQFKNTQFNYSEIKFEESQNWIEMPLLLRFNFGNHYRFLEDRNFLSHLNPYALAGFSTTYLIGSKATVSRSDKVNNEKGFETNKQINLNNMRQKIGIYGIAGAGVEYKKGRWIWSLECRYHYGITEVVKAKNRFINSDLLFSYGYVDSDIKFRNLSVSVGLAYPIYRPKQQKDFYIKDLSTKDLPQESPDEQ